MGVQRDTRMVASMTHDAIILAGGRGRRLGGLDKATIHLRNGRGRLLDHAIAAVADARTVVVGPTRRAAPSSVLWAREDPPFSGPAAAVAAGLASLRASATVPADFTIVLAVDLAAAEAAIAGLCAEVDGDTAIDGWIAQDPNGRQQPLLAVYRTGPLHQACDALSATEGLTNASMRALLTPMRLRNVRLGSALCNDIDTPAQLAAALHNTTIETGDGL
ncbi:NTP transferase domain-containing protein [Curtobacterium sp. MCSS17_005]|uniref:molybdenum cofactor guanylyltransferase n=1 Tax=Curtobacterium sp. MCSS17_005 TaxID=2175641 RepID=UPI000DA8C310|nr:NTP transferase domain-containing protein [Curtobacterium sp. MCSS17_005]WIB34332.1 NTP transferase domain-containing protein [Curtobacterium sp. MCSS17_005]